MGIYVTFEVQKDTLFLEFLQNRHLGPSEFSGNPGIPPQKSSTFDIISKTLRNGSVSGLGYFWFLTGNPRNVQKGKWTRFEDFWELCRNLSVSGNLPWDSGEFRAAYIPILRKVEKRHPFDVQKVT